MKIIKGIFIMSIYLSTCYSFAQQNTLSDSLTSYDLAFNRLKKLYLKQLDSNIYCKKKAAYRKFYKKMNFEGDVSEIAPDPIPWIKDNLEKTDFFSVTEAELEWAQYMVLDEEDQKQNSDYYNFLFESIPKFGAKIVTELMDDIVTNHLDKFLCKDSPRELYKD
ncbi:hypothetical protein [Flavobacterium suaedae]|nr:hypothetical protein [Flavobacterium suaedae]